MALNTKVRINRESKVNIWSTMSNLQQKIDKSRVELINSPSKLIHSLRNKETLEANNKGELGLKVSSIKTKLAFLTLGSAKNSVDEVKKNLKNEKFSLENPENAQVKKNKIMAILFISF